VVAELLTGRCHRRTAPAIVSPKDRDGGRLRILGITFGTKGSAAATERRLSPRSRSRLRPGKMLDADLAFLGDCAILDRSARGLRVRLFGEAIAGEAEVAVFDEHEGSVRPGQVVWRRGREAGIRVAAGPASVDADVIRRLSGPYYAVRD
jgi:hypothetical protein